MHEIKFYKDKSGNSPVLQYLRELSKRNDKDSRIKLNKINDYIQQLSKFGTQAGEPYVKHIEDDLWELRPLRDRITSPFYEANSKHPQERLNKPNGS